MADARPLRLEEGFFGAQEALTDWEEGSQRWVASLIVRERTLSEAREGAGQVLLRIAGELGLELLPESQPASQNAA
jgi:pyrrolysine biosynthesis protein PylC